MINNELKKKRYLLLLTGLLPLNQNSEILTMTYNYRSVPESSSGVYRLINNGIFVHCLYGQKHGSCKKYAFRLRSICHVLERYNF